MNSFKLAVIYYDKERNPILRFKYEKEKGNNYHFVEVLQIQRYVHQLENKWFFDRLLIFL